MRIRMLLFLVETWVGTIIYTIQTDDQGRHIIGGEDNSLNWRVERLTDDTPALKLVAVGSGLLR